MRALKETVYQAIEERCLDVKPREMRLLGDTVEICCDGQDRAVSLLHENEGT
jgi:hypothetical protein